METKRKKRSYFFTVLVLILMLYWLVLDPVLLPQASGNPTLGPDFREMIMMFAALFAIFYMETKRKKRRYVFTVLVLILMLHPLVLGPGSQPLPPGSHGSGNPTLPGPDFKRMIIMFGVLFAIFYIVRNVNNLVINPRKKRQREHQERLNLMPVCPSCKTQAAEGAKFCRKCGGALVPKKAAAPEAIAKRQSFDVRVAADPENPKLLEEYGDFLSSVGLSEDALVQLHRAAELAPQDDRLLLKIARIDEAEKQTMGQRGGPDLGRPRRLI